jgi:hypothetical protein
LTFDGTLIGDISLDKLPAEESSANALAAINAANPTFVGTSQRVNCLRQNIAYDVAVYVGQSVIAALVFKRELCVIDAQQMQYRGL